MSCNCIILVYYTSYLPVCVHLFVHMFVCLFKGLPSPKQMMHISHFLPISAKILNFTPIFVRFRFLAFQTLTMMNLRICWTFRTRNPLVFKPVPTTPEFSNQIDATGWDFAARLAGHIQKFYEVPRLLPLQQQMTYWSGGSWCAMPLPIFVTSAALAWGRRSLCSCGITT